MDNTRSYLVRIGPNTPKEVVDLFNYFLKALYNFEATDTVESCPRCVVLNDLITYFEDMLGWSKGRRVAGRIWAVLTDSARFDFGFRVYCLWCGLTQVECPHEPLKQQGNWYVHDTSHFRVDVSSIQECMPAVMTAQIPYFGEGLKAYMQKWVNQL